MGPCSLKIKNPQIDNKGVSLLTSTLSFRVHQSRCKVEATVVDPKDINPFADTDQEAPKDMPPLTVMSLTVQTIMKHKENKRGIASLVCQYFCFSSRPHRRA
jgi:DNA polymerase alpha subunit A